MTSTLYAALRHLSRGEFVSGAAIAQALGCSRATVHNALQAAAELGVKVHAVQGRGYRLAQPMDWLAVESLSAALSARGMALRFFERLDSTNTHLLEAARAGAEHRTVVLAEWQTRGRGRRGRKWQTGLGDSLTFSLLWRSLRPAAELSGLSLAVGVVLSMRLRRMGLARAQVKWPNDIVVAGEKLAGVLIELSGEALGPSAAVIGVGINLRGGAALGASLGQPITDLGSHLQAVDRNALFLDLVRGLDEGLARFEQEGFAAFHQDWNAAHAFHDRPVDILTIQGECISGVAMGVDGQGALLLRTRTGVRRFHSGEVSLRGAGA
ncbi:MAG TPA: biotin--[acetyl-CoA-carboxylase] ligase [Thiobacillaceae bacterium]|nr:biotin--[acetyl-CoA-carboxylase] ligase [Thiobacillaceae bacterium]HNU65231.1 biotin--[acetyl-CoA-carboxylase] ligase [Thiobacillaceae bacterium]